MIMCEGIVVVSQFLGEYFHPLTLDKVGGRVGEGV